VHPVQAVQVAQTGGVEAHHVGEPLGVVGQRVQAVARDVDLGPTVPVGPVDAQV